MITITGSRERDPGLLAPRMRAEDKAEVWASEGHTPQEALEAGLELSILCYTAWQGGRATAMFGVAPDTALMAETGINYGTIWFLGTDEITENPREFVRLSREWLGKLQKHFDYLGNIVDERNKVHVKWIRTMGFEFLKIRESYGIEKRTFLEFYQRC